MQFIGKSSEFIVRRLLCSNSGWLSDSGEVTWPLESNNTHLNGIFVRSQCLEYVCLISLLNKWLVSKWNGERIPFKKWWGEGFPGGIVVKNPPANAGDTGSSPGLGRSHMPRSNEARAPQLLSLRSRAHKPQPLGPASHNYWSSRT